MEIWKPIKGYEGLYEVSSMGNIRSVDRTVHTKTGDRTYLGRTIVPQIDKDGYYKVCLCKNNKPHTRYVHRIVAEAFIENPEGCPVINHKDENKRNNDFRNLEWCTVKYNTNYGDCLEKRAAHRRKPIKAIKGTEEICFASITEAAKMLGASHGNIIGCLANAYGKRTCKGYRFEYI